jgi:hypothetical protein
MGRRTRPPLLSLPAAQLGRAPSERGILARVGAVGRGCRCRRCRRTARNPGPGIRPLGRGRRCAWSSRRWNTAGRQVQAALRTWSHSFRGSGCGTGLEPLPLPFGQSPPARAADRVRVVRAAKGEAHRREPRAPRRAGSAAVAPLRHRARRLASGRRPAATDGELQLAPSAADGRGDCGLPEGAAAAGGRAQGGAQAAARGRAGPGGAPAQVDGCGMDAVAWMLLAPPRAACTLRRRNYTRWTGAAQAARHQLRQRMHSRLVAHRASGIGGVGTWRQH